MCHRSYSRRSSLPRPAWQGRFAGGALAGAFALFGAGVVRPPEPRGADRERRLDAGALIRMRWSPSWRFWRQARSSACLFPVRPSSSRAAWSRDRAHVDVFVLLGETPPGRDYVPAPRRRGAEASRREAATARGDRRSQTPSGAGAWGVLSDPGSTRILLRTVANVTASNSAGDIASCAARRPIGPRRQQAEETQRVDCQALSNHLPAPDAVDGCATRSPRLLRAAAVHSPRTVGIDDL